MNTRILLGGAALVVAIGAGVGYAVFVLPGQEFRSSLDEAIQSLPATIQASYEMADYTPLDRRATIEGLSVTWRMQPAYTIRIDRLDLTDPATDLAEVFEAARANPGAIDEAKPVPVARTLAATGIRGEISADPNTGVGDTTYTIASFTLDGLRLFPKPLLAWDPEQMMAAAATIQALPEESDPDAALAILAPLLRQYAALYLGFAYDAYAVDTMTARVDMPPPPGAADAGLPGPIEAVVSVARVAAGGYDRGTSGEGSLTGFRQTAGDLFECDIDRMTIRPFDVRPAAEQILAGAPLTAALLDTVAIGGVGIAGMRCQTGDAGAFGLDQFDFGEVRFAGGKPAKASLSLTGLKLTAENFKAAGPENPLALLGLDAVTISAGGGYAWDVPGGRVSVDDLNLAVAELGRLTVDAVLANVPADAEALAEMTLVTATARYTDASLVKRLIEQAAAQQGQDPAAYRENLVSFLEVQAAELGLPGSIRAALIEFVRSPGLLIVDLDPPAPVPLAALAQAETIGPARLVQLLGLSITTGP